jgi:hypothetical protein
MTGVGLETRRHVCMFADVELLESDERYDSDGPECMGSVGPLCDPQNDGCILKCEGNRSAEILGSIAGWRNASVRGHVAGGGGMWGVESVCA